MACKAAGRLHAVSGKDVVLSHDAITEELERILASPEFKRKPSLRGFLHFVVERTLSGCTHEIKGYTVATQVFGRGDDFDNNIDPIVRIQAGRLRRAIERYYRNEGRDNPVRIEVPKGSYVPVFQATPTEEKLPASFERSFESRLTPATFSLAIMPIANLSSDPGQDHLAYGLAQELTLELSHYRDLQVFDCYSTLCWRGKLTTKDLVRKGMKVRFALTGSVRKDKQTIKVILHLIDISTRLQVWGEQYSYKLGGMGMIHLQEDVARRVAAKAADCFGIRRSSGGPSPCCQQKKEEEL